LFLAVNLHKRLWTIPAILFLAGVVLHMTQSEAMPAFHVQEREFPVYVLDAGHGGEDGGAVSADGSKESDVNLAVTLDLDELLRFLGYNTVLTRREDASVCSEEAETLREKKASDLKNRAALVNSVPGAVLVSIHQNSLPSVPSVHGAQVFYANTALSDTLAACLQSVLNQTVNQGNEKHEKKIDPTIYLMKKAECPAVLVECGFMSNSAEAAMLQKPDYQKKLAVVIAAGLLDHDPAEGENAP